MGHVNFVIVHSLSSFMKDLISLNINNLYILSLSRWGSILIVGSTSIWTITCIRAMICFHFFLSLLNLKNQKGHPLLSLGHQKALCWSYPPDERILKRPYFPLPLSILAGSNLIIYYFFFCAVWFPRKSIPHSISGKIHHRLISEKIHAKPPGKTKKIAFFFCSLCSLDLF